MLLSLVPSLFRRDIVGRPSLVRPCLPHSVIPAQAHDCPGKRDAVNRDASSSPTPSFPRRRESKQTTTNWAFLATRLDPHLRGDDDREWRGRRSKYRVPCGRNRSNPTDPGRFDEPMLNFSGQYCAYAGMTEWELPRLTVRAGIIEAATSSCIAAFTPAAATSFRKGGPRHRPLSRRS